MRSRQLTNAAGRHGVPGGVAMHKTCQIGRYSVITPIARLPILAARLKSTAA
jgi:hypothetical protein